MKLFAACSGPCVVCTASGGCVAGRGDDHFYPRPGDVLTEMLRTGKDTRGRLLSTSDINDIRKYAPPWAGPGEPATGIAPDYLRERIVISVPLGEQHPFDPVDYKPPSPVESKHTSPAESEHPSPVPRPLIPREYLPTSCAYFDDTGLFTDDTGLFTMDLSTPRESR